MTFKMAPMINVFFLPILSAFVVRNKEMMISPRMTADWMIPIYSPVNFLSSRFFNITMAIIPYENIRNPLEMKRRKKSNLFEERSSVIFFYSLE